MDAKSQLSDMEGKENESYPDPLTGGEPWTIGRGHTGPEVCPGLVWTDEYIERVFDEDFKRAEAAVAYHWPWAQSLTEPRRAVLVNMCFQMGPGRLAKFVRMLEAARDEHFATAAEEMRRSNWFHQTPKRARRLVAQMETGEWN